MRTITIDLFSGMGGFARAAHKMGWETLVLCEIDPFCQHVLKHHFPGAYLHGDIKTLTWEIINEEIEKRLGPGWRTTTRIVLCGGFPCQPHSTAGKRLGTKDDRNLWPETIRIIGELRPDSIILENVLGLTSTLEPAGAAEMEGQASVAIRESNLFCKDECPKREKMEVPFEVVQQRFLASILEDLEEKGYESPKSADGSPIVLCIPACAINAPHRRDRVWFVANARSSGWI